MISMLKSASKDLIQIISLNNLVFRKNENRKCVYLTFDDGPDPVYTAQVLEILGRNNASASFFVIGEKVDQYPEIAKRIANSGHALAGHTYSHKMITEMTGNEMKRDLEKTRACIKKHTDVDTNLFRPPRGRMNASNILLAMLNGYRVIHWSITYSDYKRDSLERLINEMKSRELSDGDILLLHDNNQFTVDALESFIKMIKGKGYELRALPIL